MRTINFSYQMAAFIFILFSILLMPNTALSQDNNGAESDPTLDAVIKILVDSFSEYSRAEKKSSLKLKSATAELNTTIEKTAGGGIKFFVFSLGSKRTTENSSTLSVQLEIPKDQSKDKNKMLLPVNIKTFIAKAVLSAQSALSTADIGRLIPQVTYELKFTVKSEKSGSIGVADLIPVELNAEKSVTKTNVHSLKLVFDSKPSLFDF